MRKKIIIIGGSIAGCAVSVLLKQLGYETIILERSSGQIKQGSGITLPPAIINECIAKDLFDADIPQFIATGRSFFRKENNYAELFWNQSSNFNVRTLNWADIYKNLRKRINTQDYHTHASVCHIQQRKDKYFIETSGGLHYEADILIAADGIDSTVRSLLISDSKPNYSGYVAWRGVIDEKYFPDFTLIQGHFPYYVFPNGHLLLYRIPGTQGQTLINWVMYENRPDKSLTDLLMDKDGKVHSKSLPAGSLTEEHIYYLATFAKQVLPDSVYQIIRQTEQPFIQAVFDYQLPAYPENNLIFVGDCAATLRPHSASGLLKALTNAFDLAKLFAMENNHPLEKIISNWKQLQQKTMQEEILNAQNMGKALVTNPPNWHAMDQAAMDQWWLNVMQGKNWYATSGNHKQLDKNYFFNSELNNEVNSHSISSKANEEISYINGINK